MKGFLAALMTLTRLPLGKVVRLDEKYFRDTLLYWPWVGFITGSVTLAVLWSASHVMPSLPACVLAVSARLWFTGAIHEDGLADFFDGFGGGTSKEKILAIMKDSRIGGYGTIGLILYFLLYVSLLSSIDIPTLLPLVLTGDIFSKSCASVAINTLAYVRKPEESKTRIVYNRNTPVKYLFGLLPAFLSFFFIPDTLFFFAILLPVCCALILRRYLYKKIGGYTGDCCGALFLISELAFYCGCVVLYYF